MKPENIQLLTGIPRSGTTLCCHLLNARVDTIALHEPIEPATIPSACSSSDASNLIAQTCINFRQSIVSGKPIPHGHKGGLKIDNPVGLERENGIRKVVAQRGMLTVPQPEKPDFLLVVKQNAMFTALIPELKGKFPITSIVRNPIDVLLSWMTVDLPVQRGRIPAGERFSQRLRESLKDKDVLQRQLVIYQWFVTQFISHGLNVLRYEDILASSGKVLDSALGVACLEREPLKPKKRQFEVQIIDVLEKALPLIQNLELNNLYTSEEVLGAFEGVLSQTKFKQY